MLHLTAFRDDFTKWLPHTECMTTQRRSIFADSAMQTPTGDLGSEGIKPSTHMDTSGHNGGLGYSETGQAEVRCYAETRDCLSSTIIAGGAAGIALPTGDRNGDHSDRFTTKGK